MCDCVQTNLSHMYTFTWRVIYEYQSSYMRACRTATSMLDPKRSRRLLSGETANGEQGKRNALDTYASMSVNLLNFCFCLCIHLLIHTDSALRLWSDFNPNPCYAKMRQGSYISSYNPSSALMGYVVVIPSHVLLVIMYRNNNDVQRCWFNSATHCECGLNSTNRMQKKAVTSSI